jgi:hypothetical protein
MSKTLIWDLRDKAELLTFLVVCQLAAKYRRGAWLRVDDVVGCERIWLQSANADVSVMERVSIASWSETLAIRVENDLDERVKEELAKGFTPRTGSLDFRFPVVRMAYLRCFNHLAEMGWFVRGRFRLAIKDNP